MILGQLRAAAIQLRPDVRVRNGLEAVLRTDLAIKSSAGIPQHLLECLAVELCAQIGDVGVEISTGSLFTHASA